MGISINIQKSYPDFTLDVQFESESKRIGILGSSGCGKSLTLKSIAGIEKPDQGKVQINGTDMFCSEQRINLKPQKRNIGYLFQNYALFPTMTVQANIACGMQMAKKAKREKVSRLMQKFQLEGLENRYPGELSGGQQQRVALARIMAYEPDVILLDEPYSALDEFLKDRVQQEMQEILGTYPGIVILVSHSRDEIYRFSEELLIMNQGKTVCFGNTKEIFKEPGYREAARLTGCKNIAKLNRLKGNLIEVPDWGITLELKNNINDNVQYVGIRAHDPEPVWGERTVNSIPFCIESNAEELFEFKYFLKLPMAAHSNFCWFVQKGKKWLWQKTSMPDYLYLPEEKLLWLK